MPRGGGGGTRQEMDSLDPDEVKRGVRRGWATLGRRWGGESQGSAHATSSNTKKCEKKKKKHGLKKQGTSAQRRTDQQTLR